MKIIRKTSGRYRYLYLYVIVLACIALTSIYLIKIRELEAFYTQIHNEIIEDSRLVSEKSYIEGKKKEPVYITLKGADPVRAVVEDYNQPTSIWKLVNKLNPLPESYVADNLIVPEVSRANNMPVRSELVVPLKNMFDAARADNAYLILASAYRSYDYQKTIFNNLAASIGQAQANQSIAQPGQSEHQTGLAVDIAGTNNQCYILTCFTDTKEGKWLAANAHRYGFILRYPSGKENITGYIFEPWHFRYLGTELATAIYRSGLTYEEAYPKLSEALASLRVNGAL